ncbi:MAG: hypothetical protein FJ030_03230, partial [Chloroflexi bacterium]|nr:hypothetical protein [Chloroflexota bacterium]
MEIKGKHVYGLGAAAVGGAALVFALIAWFINQKIDTTVQVGFAVGLLGIALFAWLEIDLLTRLLKSRQVRYGAESLAYVLLFVTVIVLINVIFTRERLKTRWDLTETKQNTLSAETIKVLGELTEPVKVVGFYSGQAFGRESAEELLDSYRNASGGKFDYEFVDPFLKPTLAQEYSVTRDGSLVVVRGDQRESVTTADEPSLTNAIVRLNNPTMRAIYFIGGHGEKSPDETGNGGMSQIKTLLQGVNYEVKTLDVISTTVPEDAAAIVVAGPTKPYSAAEVDIIGQYLAGGGKAVILAEPSVLSGVEAGQSDPLVDYLSQTWGITLRDDIVVDPVQYIAQFDPTVPATVNYSTSSITTDLTDIISFFPSARSIALADAGAGPADVNAVSVVSTGPDAWGETNFESLSTGQWAADDADAKGAMIVAATGENFTTKGRVVVFGDSDFGANLFWQSNVANGTILLNAIKWATAQDDLITLTPRDTVTRTLNVYTNRDIAIVILLGCILPPFVVMVIAASVWWSRRR